MSQPLPPGPFDLIYADPPWRYNYSLPSVGQDIERHYETLTPQQVAHLPIRELAAKNAVLLLWSTCPKLEEALMVMRSWGFGYRQQLVWEKLTASGGQNHGMGHWLKGNHEILLLGIRGAPGTPADDCRPPSVFRARRAEHSAKPKAVYAMIDMMFPHLPRRLELFARGRPTLGWTCWGDEVPSDASPTPEE